MELQLIQIQLQYLKNKYKAEQKNAKYKCMCIRL